MSTWPAPMRTRSGEPPRQRQRCRQVWPPRRLARYRAHGSAMLEVLASLGLASILLAACAATLQRSGHQLASVRQRMRLLSAARSQLESARASPCAPSPPCPRGFRCTVERTASVHAGLERLSVHVAADGSSTTPVRVGLVVASPQPCNADENGGRQ